MTTAATSEGRRIVLPGAACRIRKLQELTQAQVSTRAGAGDNGKPLIDHTTISRVEKGERSIGLTQMYALAAGLGVHIDDISYVLPVPVEAAA